MALPRELALSPTQIEELMATQLEHALATIGPQNRINLTRCGSLGGAGLFLRPWQKV